MTLSWLGERDQGTLTTVKKSPVAPSKDEYKAFDFHISWPVL